MSEYCLRGLQFADPSPLEVLDFNNNQLTGGISGAVFNGTWLPSLTLLNLSKKDAAGPLPIEIASLPNLTTLDVSHNDLSGSLFFIEPSNRLYNPSFFAGNGRLCGGPLAPCSTHARAVQWWVLLIIIGGSVIIAIGSCLAAAWQWRV